MSNFQEYFLCAGIWAWPALISVIYLFVTGIVLLLVTKMEKTIYIYLLFTFLPIIFGIIGTIFELRYLEIDIVGDPSIAKETVEYYKNEAWIPFKFGLYLSIPLLLLALIGIQKTKKYNPQINLTALLTRRILWF